MPCRIETDAHGTTFHIEAEAALKTPGGDVRPACPAIDCWWSRNGKKADETFIIRQEYPDREMADVVEITFGQLYDLIDAANKAVENQ